MDKAFITTLKQKEKELDSELKKSPVYKQLLAIRETIKSFEESPMKQETGDRIEEPAISYNGYDSSSTWENKILYVLNNIKKGTVIQITGELEKIDKSLDQERLKKRVTVTCSWLLKESVIKKVGKEGKNFIYALK